MADFDLGPASYRVALTIRGKDYEYGGASGGKLSNFKNELKGCGPFLHDDPIDRPARIFGGTTTLHFGRDMGAYLLLPVIPAKKAARTPAKKTVKKVKSRPTRMRLSHVAAPALLALGDGGK